MSGPISENDFLHELKAVVTVELTMAEVSQSQDDRDVPVSDWLLDPVETERARVGALGILAAITELQNGSPFRPSIGRGLMREQP
ncbi:hypothetical protein JOL79_14715 [Microbispora sp. RL4-1S]|uniref:Uncharacterized protein n=1 Tax=Microbispora oryzae TaxID=2806554 RepID=A0A940WQ43_9ACTN|nr:hypothetical protein [Microbispora oryzae]MBP2705066.1 hypothetical protein [Microbispora oryzae]